MDFTLSSDQEALRDGVRDFCRRRYGEEALTAQTPADRSLWSDLAGLGLFSLRADAGSDRALYLEDMASDPVTHIGAVEAAIAFEELGRALVPGPLVASYLAGGLVDGAAEGVQIVGWLEAEGDPLLFEHPDLVDGVLVLRDALVQFVDMSEVRWEAVASPVDPLTPLGRATENPLKLTPAGFPEDFVGADGHDLRLLGALVTSAYQVGIASEVTDRSVAYAKEREQFGRSIGSFQAVKHLLADMYVRAQLAQAAVHAAAVTLDDLSVGDPNRAVTVAKVLADEAALLDTKDAIQVHGGMGFTWEVPVHLYFKRARVLALSFPGQPADLAYLV